MDPEVSRRIDVLRIILIGLIVVIHGGLVLLSPDAPQVRPVTQVAIDVLQLHVAPSAVLTFFAISGFLFLGKAELSLSAYGTMLRNKFFSLFVPYLLFNLVVLAAVFFFGSMYLLGSWGFVLKRGVIVELLGLGGMPINSPLWFVRDLLVLFVFSPVLLFFYKKAPNLGLVLLCCLWLGRHVWNFLYYGESFFVFYLGGYLARRGLIRPGVTRWQRLGFWATLAATPVMVVLMPLGIVDMRFWGLPNKVYFLLGMVFFWRLSALPAIRDCAVLHRMSKQSFFIYLAHIPVISVLLGQLHKVWRPATDPAQLGSYYLIGLSVIVILWRAGDFFSRVAPGIYALATGGAGRPRNRAAVRGDSGTAAPVSPARYASSFYVMKRLFLLLSKKNLPSCRDIRIQDLDWRD